MTQITINSLDFFSISGVLSRIPKNERGYTVAEHACSCVQQALQENMSPEVCVAVFAKHLLLAGVESQCLIDWGVDICSNDHLTTTINDIVVSDASSGFKTFLQPEEASALFNTYARLLSLVDADLRPISLNGKIKRPRTAYVAGPMRGIPQYNFPAFDSARDRLVAAGWNAISPADLDRAHGFDGIKGKVPEKRDCIERDVLAIIRQCDTIALLPGWTKSKGSAVEVALGIFLDLHFIDAVTLKSINMNGE